MRAPRPGHLWVEPDQLLPEIDEVRGLTAFFLEDMAEAEHVLTF